MKLLTYSRLKAYRRCSRYEHLAYVDGWRSTRDGTAAAFGTLWHTGMDAWFAAKRDGRPALYDAVRAVAGKASDPYAQAMLDAMLDSYDARWTDQTYEVVGIEEEFRCPLLHPDTLEPHPHWSLAGKIDKRVTEWGRRLPLDHKTTSRDVSPGADYWLTLQMDHQISNYMLGCEALDFPPDGFIYDVARKPALRPLGANSRRSEPETPEAYGLRIREAIAENPHAYFVRQEIPRIESQLRDFLSDAWQQAETMAEAHAAGRSHRNPESCFAMGRCEFWQVCSAGLRPEEHPDLYRRLDYVHPELSDDQAA